MLHTFYFFIQAFDLVSQRDPDIFAADCLVDFVAVLSSFFECGHEFCLVNLIFALRDYLVLVVRLLAGFEFVILIKEILTSYYQLANPKFLKMAILTKFHLYMKTLILGKFAILLSCNQK